MLQMTRRLLGSHHVPGHQHDHWPSRSQFVITDADLVIAAADPLSCCYSSFRCCPAPFWLSLSGMALASLADDINFVNDSSSCCLRHSAVNMTCNIPGIHNTFGNNSFCCCLSAGVEHSAILLTTGHQEGTIQMATENICVWD